MKILAIYLVFFKGYSVMRFTNYYGDINEKEYGACNKPMTDDYGHDGVWGVGNTPFEAVIDCYKKANNL